MRTVSNQSKREMLLRKITVMMQGLYIAQVTMVLLVGMVTGFRYLIHGEVPTMQMVIILLLVMTVLLIFNGYFIIRDTSLFKRMNTQIEIKDESYRNIEALNLELRAQRHDFLNHIQILYSLMELEAYEETTDYLNKLYGDVGKLSANIRTDSVAFNALLQAKANEAEAMGIGYLTDINSRLEGLNMPDWELCRVVGNMLDNAFRAAKNQQANRNVKVELHENITDYRMRISNTSGPVDDKAIKSFFEPGFTTKKVSENHGMGLYISDQLMKRYGNTIHMSYKDGWVTVEITMDKKTVVNGMDS